MPLDGDITNRVPQFSWWSPGFKRPESITYQALGHPGKTPSPPIMCCPDFSSRAIRMAIYAGAICALAFAAYVYWINI